MDYSNQLYTCNKCGFCLANCPIYKQTGDETYTARGLLTLAEAVQNGALQYSALLNDRLSTCIRCQACAQDCPSGLKPFELIQKTKEMIVAQNGMDVPKRLFCRTIVKNQWLLGKALKWGSSLGQLEGNVPNSAGKNFMRLLPEVLKVEKPKANIGFFVGCATNLWYPQIGLATVKLLTDAGFQVTIPRKQKCCGTPVQALGDYEAAKKLMEENTQAFENVDLIVTSCASCGLMLKTDCARFAVPKTFREKVRDISEFLLDIRYRMPARNSHDSRLSTHDLRVTYHDPCHLNRGQGISKQPRQLIEKAGCKLIEAQNAAQCCGGGGTFRLFNQDLAIKIAKEKIDAAFESQASTLVTSCPGCIMQFNDVFQQTGKGLQVKHVVELLV